MSFVPASLLPVPGALDRLGFGAAQLGNLYQEVSDETAHEAVDAAWAAGLRYYDTAPHYGLGLSERRLGAALAGRPREEFLLSTKVGRLLRPNPEPTETDLDNGFAVPGDLRRERDFTGDGVRASLAESLERLGLDRVDIVWVHDPDEPTDRFDEALAGAVPTLERLRDEGVIGAWGVGSKDPEMLHRFATRSTPDLVMVAGRYTLLEQDQRLMDACRDHGVGVVAVGVFNSGLLAQPRPAGDARYEYGEAPPELLDRARELARACERFDVTLPQAALAYPRRHPAVVNVCVGMRTARHVRSNCDLEASPVPEDLWADLARRGLIPEEER